MSYYGRQGLIRDLIVGVIGAFIGDWLLPRLGIHLGVGAIALIINATIGAIILLVIIRVVAGNLRGCPLGDTGIGSHADRLACRDFACLRDADRLPEASLALVKLILRH
jgi:uncharacterized membrane protein YeaQ/YmgE (transglycosylase-associated protein family)